MIPAVFRNLIADRLARWFGAPWHDCDLPHTQPDPDGYIDLTDEEAATFMAAIKGRDRIDDLTDRVEMLYALCIDIRNEIRALTTTPTETDLLNMAAADQRIAERLKHRK